MIELRWVEREVPCAWDIKESFVTMLKKEKVLQYRISDSCVDAIGTYRKAGDWIDVPTQEKKP